MAGMLPFDAASSRRVARTYETPDVAGQRARTLELLEARPGERVLDVGTGPGQLLAAIADAVGPTGLAHGVDPSPSMVEMARQCCAERALVQESGLDGAGSLPDGPFDAVTCTQVLEYVADLPAALREIARVLRPGGRVLLLDTDWDSVVWNVADRDRHRRVLRAWEAHLHDPRLPCTLGPRLRDAGFTGVSVDPIPLLNPAFDENSYSAGMLEMVTDFVLGRGDLDPDTVHAWRADVRERDDYFFSLNRYCFRATRP